MHHRRLRSARRWSIGAVAVGLLCMPTAVVHGRAPATGTVVPSTDWTAYLDGPLHDSDAAHETAITATAVVGLRQRWSFTNGGEYFASPTVFNGAVYIGGSDGWLYKLSAATGAVEAKSFLGTNPDLTCGPPPTGIVSTATISPNPATKVPTVYVSGANGYLYALRASTLAIEWRSVIALRSPTANDYYDWSSPTVANGRIYVGVASNCDMPLVRGGLIAFDQSTGRKLGEFFTVPSGQVGGSIWSSVAVGVNGDVYASTGNGPLGSPAQQLLGYSESILKLSPTLGLLGSFQIPASEEGNDTDFGSSPVLFGAFVGACNKNGTFYALSQATMKLEWQAQVSNSDYSLEACIGTPAWDGKHLFFATPAITEHGVSYAGSLQERGPAGKLYWFTGLPNAVDGSPSLDGAGVLAVGTYAYEPTANATYLVSTATGHLLKTIESGRDFPQSTFAEHWLFVANQNGVYAWGAQPLG